MTALVTFEDVKPLINRNKDNVLSKVEVVRDEIYDYFLQACRAEGIDALILKSYPYSDSVWVKFECWVRRSGETLLTDRSTATLTIIPREFHRYDHVINLEIKEGQKTKRYSSIVELEPANVKALVRYMLRRTEFDIFGFKRCRTYPWELWLPDNNVTRLKRDWVPVIVAALFFAGFFFFLIVPVAGLLLILVAAALTWFNLKRRTYFLSPGKPALEPRKLLRMDSWQTLVRDIGRETQNLKADVRKELELGLTQGVSLSDEKIWYLGVDGPEEREQLVVTFRRAIGFIHIYPYGNDLYVGWDAHVNSGTWLERQVAMGIEPQTGELCRVNTIESGWHVPNEYDITDANCLIEWVHAAITKITKKVLAEYKIDQEIDFKILRGERQGVAGRQDPESKPKSNFTGFKFKREA